MYPSYKGQGATTPENAIFRFWSKVDKTGDCWIWMSGRDKDGYGFFKPDRNLKTMRAHRFAYEITYGTVDPKLLVCHSCDNPSCVRPEHLFVGTHSDNVHDMHQKRRWHYGDDHPSRKRPETRPRGEKHWNAMLTSSQVLEIRKQWSEGIPQTVIAEQFGVTHFAIWRIVHRKCWRHIPE